MYFKVKLLIQCWGKLLNALRYYVNPPKSGLVTFYGMQCVTLASLFITWVGLTHKNLFDIITKCAYIYIYAFSRRFYPKRLTVHSGYTFFVSMCVPWEFNPQPFELLTQYSTTEPQEHLSVLKCVKKQS